MPNSLRARLKNLVHKGILTQKDCVGTKHNPTDENEKALKAAKVIKEYCKSMPADCGNCIFYDKEFAIYGCKLHNPNRVPEVWEIKKEGEQDG
mgnify:CR=1 FL=1